MPQRPFSNGCTIRDQCTLYSWQNDLEGVTTRLHDGDLDSFHPPWKHARELAVAFLWNPGDIIYRCWGVEWREYSSRDTVLFPCYTRHHQAFCAGWGMLHTHTSADKGGTGDAKKGLVCTPQPLRLLSSRCERRRCSTLAYSLDAHGDDSWRRSSERVIRTWSSPSGIDSRQLRAGENLRHLRFEHALTMFDWCHRNPSVG